MVDEHLGGHVFVFNNSDNGGEQLVLTTDFFSGDRGGVYSNQELTLMSYCNSASFNLSGCQFTPELLRELANQLDSEFAKRRKV